MRHLTQNITPGNLAGNGGAGRPAPIDSRGIDGGAGGLSLAQRVAASQIQALAKNAEEVATLATALAATGFGSEQGLKPDDLAALGLDRLRELSRTAATRNSAPRTAGAHRDEFAGYSMNELLASASAGDVLVAASTFRTTVQGASQSALEHLGAAKLAELQALIDGAIAATQASSGGYYL